MAKFYLAEAYNYYHMAHIGLFASLELAKEASNKWYEKRLLEKFNEYPHEFDDKPIAYIGWDEGVERSGHGEQPFAILTGEPSNISYFDAFIISEMEVQNE